ncbi:WD40 repeat-like protein [Hesseltinella vesiculosa]|uniref:WD40 repeat-like protein n=1 Tax=Hesseltinella vesiculosa TaxID=101127 RepID=A0A1X2GUG6_9FUNG|nr:WD40 repeat-like protein [Hesseltinella vesiculosa]
MVGTPFQPSVNNMNNNLGIFMSNLLGSTSVNSNPPHSTPMAMNPSNQQQPFLSSPSTSMPEPSLPSSQDLQNLVSAYFERKGYQKKDLAYLHDAQGNTITMTQLIQYLKTKLAERPTHTNSILQHIVQHDQPQDLLDPNAYLNQYTALRNWVLRGLEEYKAELRLVLYPILVHCFLDLVAAELPDQAKALLEQHAQEHRCNEQHDQELDEFAQISASQLQDHALAQKYRRNKYHISMTAIPHELFVNYIQETMWNPLIFIATQYLSIQVLHDKSAGGSEANCIGILDNGLENAKLKNEEDDDDMLVDGTVVKQEMSLDGPSLSDMSMSPMDRERVEAELESLKQLRKRVSAGSVSLPSVCSYTFYNTHDSLNCLSFSQDTSLVAGGFDDSTVKVWSLSNESIQSKPGTNYARLVGHAGPVYGASFNHDNQFMITCSQDHTARLWNLNSWTNDVVYKSHNYPVWDVDVGPFGFYFATASHDRTARLWSCDHTNPLRIFAGHLSDVDTVKFHPNSKYLVTGSSDKTARLWDVQRGTCVRVFTGHTGAVKTVAISPNGRLLATAGADRTIQLWDLGSGRRMKTMVGHQDYVYSLDFSSDSHVLVSGGADCTVRVWDVNKDVSGSSASSNATIGSGAGSASGSSSRSNNPNGSNAGSSSSNKRIRMEEAQRKGKKDKKLDDKSKVVESRDQLSVLPTKLMPVYTVKYTQKNLCMVAGTYSP